jgi:hypothetical protein
MIGAPGATGATGELGPTGSTGGPGIAIYNGSQIPADIGAEGDYFINTNREIYQYSGGGWTGLFSPDAYISSIRTDEIMTKTSQFQSTITLSNISTFTSTFRYTNAAETFAIPAGVSQLTFTVLGGGGANLGGAGALVTGTYDVQAGDSNIGIYVGQGGQINGYPSRGARFIGSNYDLLSSGASAAVTTNSNSLGGGGGAASGIVFPNGSNAIIAAGGGGGYSFGEFVYQGGAGGSAFGFEPSVPSLRLLLRASNYSGTGAWLDESGSGNHATLFTEVGFDIKNTAGNGLILGSYAGWQIRDLELGNTWTLEAWYKQDPFENSPQGVSIITQEGELLDTVNFRYLGRVSSNRSVSAGFYNGAQDSFLQPTRVSLDGVWAHYTGTWDGSTMKIYKNAVLQNTSQIAYTSENTGGPYYIGKHFNQGNQSLILGEIGEIRAYNYAINQAKVTADYNESLATFPNPNPISTYTFTVTLPGTAYTTQIQVNYDASVGYSFNTNSISGSEQKVYDAGAFTGTLPPSTTTFYVESIIDSTNPTVGSFYFRMQPPQAFLDAVNGELGLFGATVFSTRYTNPATCYFAFDFQNTNFVSAALYGISTNDLGEINFPGTVSNLTPPPPSAITGLASGGTITSSVLDIIWYGGRGVGTITFTFSLNDTPTTPSATSVSATGEGTATFDNLLPEYQYTVKVTATSSGGSVNSSSLPLTTLPLPPSAITGLAESEVTETSFVISWSGGTGTNVTITYALNGVTTTPSSTGTGTATFTGLTDGTAYEVTVTATNSGGINIQQSQVTTIPLPPSAITGLTVSDLTESSFTITWSGGTGSNVITTFKLDEVPTTPFSTGTGTATFTELTPGAEYVVKVIATNTAGFVDASETVTTTA